MTNEISLYFSKFKNVCQIFIISSDTSDYHIKGSPIQPLSLYSLRSEFHKCFCLNFSETVIHCLTPFRAPLNKYKKMYPESCSHVTILFSMTVNKMTAHKFQPSSWSGFSVHSSSKTSAFSLTSNIIWQTACEKRTCLLPGGRARTLHKYYLASSRRIRYALGFIIFASAINIKMLFSSLFVHALALKFYPYLQFKSFANKQNTALKTLGSFDPSANLYFIA